MHQHSLLSWAIPWQSPPDPWSQPASEESYLEDRPEIHPFIGRKPFRNRARKGVSCFKTIDYSPNRSVRPSDRSGSSRDPLDHDSTPQSAVGIAPWLPPPAFVTETARLLAIKTEHGKRNWFRDRTIMTLVSISVVKRQRLQSGRAKRTRKTSETQSILTNPNDSNWNIGKISRYLDAQEEVGAHSTRVNLGWKPN